MLSNGTLGTSFFKHYCPKFSDIPIGIILLMDLCNEAVTSVTNNFYFFFPI